MYRATKRVETTRRAGYSLGKSKVSDLHVALRVDQEIFRLQIAVHDIQRVEIFKGQQNLGGVEAGLSFPGQEHNRESENDVGESLSFLVKLKLSFRWTGIIFGSFVIRVRYLLNY